MKLAVVTCEPGPGRFGPIFAVPSTRDDSSGSMLPRMAEAQKAGAQFFEKILRQGDKAFVVAFDKEPQRATEMNPRQRERLIAEIG